MRIVIGLALVSGLWSQTFEVASIKASDPEVRGNTFNYTPGGGLTILNSTLRAIIQSAYDVPGFEIEGGPAWINSQRFDVIAKSEAGNRGDDGQTRLKLQALLAERFRLSVRQEAREMGATSRLGSTYSRGSGRATHTMLGFGRLGPEVAAGKLASFTPHTRARFRRFKRLELPLHLRRTGVATWVILQLSGRHLHSRCLPGAEPDLLARGALAHMPARRVSPSVDRLAGP